MAVAGALFSCLCVFVAARAHAQIVNLSTNATISIPVIGGTTTVTVPVHVLGNTVNLNVNVTGTGGGISILPTNVTLPVTISGRTVDLSLSISPGSIPILGGQSSITFPVGITLPPEVLTAVISTTGASISVRRNDALLGLDLGLDRQTDLLGGVGGDATSVWSDPMALGGMRLGGFIGEVGAVHGSDPIDPGRVSFATSLQQAQQANASPGHMPYGLGATSRAPPSAKSPFDFWFEGLSGLHRVVHLEC